MHSSGGNAALTWSGVYHTSKHSSYYVFQDICQDFVLEALFWVGLISCSSNPKPLLLIPKRHI